MHMREKIQILLILMPGQLKLSFRIQTNVALGGQPAILHWHLCLIWDF